MGALFIAFEHEMPDLDLSAQAPALVEHEELLAEVADELHVPHLMAFFHKSAEDMEEFMEDEVEGQEADDGVDLWFEAEDGRNTFDSLLHHFADHPDETPDEVLNELKAFDKILEQAEEHQVRWHFEMDF